MGNEVVIERPSNQAHGSRHLEHVHDNRCFERIDDLNQRIVCGFNGEPFDPFRYTQAQMDSALAAERAVTWIAAINAADAVRMRATTDGEASMGLRVLEALAVAQKESSHD